MFVSVKVKTSNVPVIVPGVNTILNRSQSGGGDRKLLLVGSSGGDDNDNDIDDDADIYTVESSQHSTSLRGGGGGGGSSSHHSNSNKLTYSDDGDTNKRGGVVGGVVNSVNGVVGGVMGGSKAVVGGVVGGSKAVAGGVVGGSKAVVGGVGRGGKAVVGGVVGGGKAVVEGVGGGGKTLVDGVNQSATTLTKGVDGVLNRGAKNLDDFANRSAKTIQGSANKVVGGVVGVGSSVVGVGTSLLNFNRNVSSSIIKEQDEQQQQQQQQESTGSTRNLKRATSTQNVKRNASIGSSSGGGSSHRNVLGGFLTAQAAVTSEELRGGDGDRSVATTKTATKSSSTSKSSSNNNISSKKNRRMSALVRAPSIQEMGFGRDNDAAADDTAAAATTMTRAVTEEFKSSSSKSTKLSRRRSAFGAVPGGYCSSEEKPGTTSTSTCTSSTIAKDIKRKKGGGSNRRMSGESVTSSCDDNVGHNMGYGDSEDDAAAMIAPSSSSSKTKKVGRRRSVFGAVTGGYVSSEENQLPRKPAAGGGSVASSDDDMGYVGGDDTAVTLSRSSSAKAPATTKTIGRRRSAFGAVSGGYCSSEENPTSKVVGKMSGVKIIPGKMGGGGGGRCDVSVNSGDDDMGYGDDGTTPSRPKAKTRVGRRRSAFGAITGGYVSSEDLKLGGGAKSGAEIISAKTGHDSGIAVSNDDDMGYGDAAPVAPKANKMVSRRRASAFGGGYCSFDEDDRQKEEDPVACSEPLGHSSCHSADFVPPGGKVKRMGRRKSAFGAVPGGFVADNNNAIQFNPDNLIQFNPDNLIQFNPDNLIQFNPDNVIQFNPDTAIGIQFTPNSPANAAMNEQDEEQHVAPTVLATETASPPPKTPKTPKKASSSKEEEEEHDGECSSPTSLKKAGRTPTVVPKTPKKASISKEDKCKTPKKVKPSDGVTEGTTPKSSTSTGITDKRKMVKLTKEEVDGLGEVGQQEICKVNNKKVIRVKRRAATNKMSEADGANVVAAMGGTSAETTITKDGRKVIKFKVKRKDKAADNDAECDIKSVGGRSIGGTLNSLNFFKKNSGDGTPGSPASPKKKSMGGMFKRGPNEGTMGMSSRSLKSVSGRSDDDNKSIRSVRSTRSTKTAKSGAARVLDKAKTWFKNIAGNVRKTDEFGCIDDDDITSNSGNKPSRQNTANDTLGLPSVTTAASPDGGPPTEIHGNKTCTKPRMAPAGRAAIVQKQWLAGGTNFKTTEFVMTTATSHDDSDSDNSSQHGPYREKVAAGDDVSEISFDELPLLTLPVHFPAGAHQLTEVEFWKNVCEERTKLYGTKHQLTADAYLCKGNAELCVHDYESAIKSLLKGVSYLHLLYGDSHPRIARGLHLLGAAACFNGQLVFAEESTLSALEMRRNALGVCHVDTIDTFANLGMIYYKMENLPEAGRIFSELVQLRTAIFGKPHPSIAYANRSLAQVFASMGEKKKAQKYYVKALKTFDKLEMIRDLDETEAEMKRFDIDVPLKVKEESTSAPTTAAPTTSEDRPTSTRIRV